MLHLALRLMRVFHDITQKELAELLGISNSHISEIEAGKKTPTLAVLVRYAERETCVKGGNPFEGISWHHKSSVLL